MYARGHARQDLYLDDGDRTRFIAIVRRVFREEGVRCLVWALMSNHYHFVVESGASSVSLVFQRINTRFAMHFNRRHERTGYVFQGRFGSRLVDTESYLIRLIGYVLLNPLQAGVVRTVDALQAYPWTAYPALVGSSSTRLVDVDGVLSLFGAERQDAIGSLRAYLSSSQAMDAPSAETLGLSARVQADSRAFGVEGVQGRVEFIDRIVQRLDTRAARKLAMEARGWSVRTLVDATCRRVGADIASVRNGRRTAAESLARALIAHVACDVVGTSEASVARETGVSPQAIARARRSGRQLIGAMGIAADELVG